MALQVMITPIHLSLVLAGDSSGGIPNGVGLNDGLLLVVKLVAFGVSTLVVLVAVLLFKFALAMVLFVAASGSGLTSTPEPAFPLLLVLLAVVASMYMVFTFSCSPPSK